MAEGLENGKTKVMGIDVDISSILGEKIVDQYLAQLKPEDMETILKYIESDLFILAPHAYLGDGTYGPKLLVKQREKDHWGNYRDKEIPIGELIKNHFNERIKEELKNKVEEIIASIDYQKKIEELANELVDFSINGYKEAMKNRIVERMVGNVMDAQPYFSGQSLIQIINQVIDSRLH